MHLPIPTGGVLASPYTSTIGIQPQSQPQFSTVTGPMPPQSPVAAQVNQPGGLHGNSDDQTDDASNYIESYVDFSEYYKAIEAHGEDYVINSVQL